ncbi:hypothetical protein DAH66_09800 [Sphingomonas koreensis]|uniref:Uncharacterized protein n=1 Tax=Sphingomonas koreensis TaxID=93064 RepID=A0A430G486_9SPHN|nr:hypothetical protein [Sphingomonas koreensis]RSY85976.1 hypothetical protein DAH66_09800 [Sphingomonas koreensis]
MPTDWEQFQQSIARDAFSPIDNAQVERRNCTTRIIIGRDGSIRERVALQTISPEHREQLILLHYLRHYGLCYVEDVMGLNIVSRDAPWDFEIELSTGEHFFVEITAIADGRFQFEREKREERLRRAALRKTIRVRDLRKLNEMFDIPALEAVAVLHQNTPADLEIDNPLCPESVQLLMGMIQPATRPLDAQIVEAVASKVAKRHDNKDRTTLILDFRGNFPSQDELLAAADTLGPLLDQAPFREIWFYIGYFSNDQGNDAEFALTPLKLGQDKAEKLAALIENKGLDEFGRLIL